MLLLRVLLKAWIMHVFDTLKQYTNAHTISSRPTAKDVKCFWHWLVGELYEGSIYKHNNFSSTKLWQIHSQTALNSQQKENSKFKQICTLLVEFKEQQGTWAIKQDVVIFNISQFFFQPIKILHQISRRENLKLI